MRLNIFILLGIFASSTLSWAQRMQPVDLGLPSGTLWANMNVGANAPEDYGDYFAWGEVEPKRYYGQKSVYKHFDAVSYRKYNYIPFRSSVCDYISVLEDEDDAAIQNSTSDWRMPKAEDFAELLDTNICTLTPCERERQGIRIRGVIVRNKNHGVGDSIFLPYAGNKDFGNYRYFAGTEGYYWSSTLVEQKVMSMPLDSIPKKKKAPRSAISLFLTNGGTQMMGAQLMSLDRRIGCVIRPVRNKTNE